MRLAPALFLALLTLGSCTSPTGPTDLAEQLRLSRDRWAQTGLADYQYTITRGCYCPPETVGPVVVEVRAGQVVSRRYAGGSAVDPRFADLFVTVPGLFDLIEEAISRPAAAVSVKYHPTLGYPESIGIDWLAGAMDDEVSYRVSDFASLAN
jgi:hypothetical protein